MDAIRRIYEKSSKGIKLGELGKKGEGKETPTSFQETVGTGKNSELSHGEKERLRETVSKGYFKF